MGGGAGGFLGGGPGVFGNFIWVWWLGAGKIFPPPLGKEFNPFGELMFFFVGDIFFFWGPVGWHPRKGLGLGPGAPPKAPQKKSPPFSRRE